MTSSANKGAVLSAPLQGFTTRVWRAAHASVFGGVQVYYAPFMRVEHGAIREKYFTEVQREGDVPNLVPQVLAGTPIEMRLMVTTLRDMGHRRIDINLGCPHPPVALKGRGSGLLARPLELENMLHALAAIDDVTYSVKMRLGWDDETQWRWVLPMLQLINPVSVVVHPRIGRDLYKGVLRINQFESLLSEATCPVVFNGDITSQQQAHDIMARYPELAGVMVGRAMVSWPHRFTSESLELRQAYSDFHRLLLEGYAQRLQGGPHQLLTCMKAQWALLLPDADRRARKAIAKARDMGQYEQAVTALLSSL